MDNAVPTIDITPYLDGSDRQKVAREVSAACETIGFLLIRGHGVPNRIIENVVEATKQFFALPLETKLLSSSPGQGIYRGYQPCEDSSLAQSRGDTAHPDLREGFSINRVQDKTDPYFSAPAAGNLFAPNVWPAFPVVPRFQDAMTAYYLAIENLSASLMRIFALALDLHEHFFDDKVDKHFSNLVAYHYPPLARAPLPGQSRGGAHTDFGSLTLVQGHPSADGLQVWSDGRWVDVPVAPDTFVVNIGDLMAQWTNDRWVSTLHRVVVPPEATWQKPRYSIVFFHQPNYDAVVECLDKTAPPRYAPVTSGEHLQRKLSAMTLVKKE